MTFKYTFLTRWGFNAASLPFALRTALGCCLAVWVAWYAGLEHPQWAGMTVWVAAQPWRDHLLTKSLFRVLGTLSGSLVGVGVLMLSQGDFLLVVFALALWCGLCVGIGNLQRGFVAYGTLLAGYSAAMVALLGTTQPDHIMALGLDRFLTVLTGVLVAVVTTWMFVPYASHQEIKQRLDFICRRVKRFCTRSIDPQSLEYRDTKHLLLADIAALDVALEAHGAGAWRSRRFVRIARALLVRQVARLTASDPNSQRSQNGSSLVPAHRVVIHRDWIGACQAMVRTASAIACVGVLGWWVQWQAAPYMLLGVAVLTSLFSTFDNPVRTMRFVILGQMMGVLAALVCRWYVWPLADHVVWLIVMMCPFILLGGLLLAHRRTALCGIDFNMAFLLLLQPVFPAQTTVSQSLGIALAVALSAVSAWLAYRCIYPTDAQRRVQLIQQMMWRDVRRLSSHAGPVVSLWQARLRHRLIRMSSLSGASGPDRALILDQGLAIAGLGDWIPDLQQLLAQPTTPLRVRRCVYILLSRIRRMHRHPARLLATLRRVEHALPPQWSGMAQQCTQFRRALTTPI